MNLNYNPWKIKFSSSLSVFFVWVVQQQVEGVVCVEGAGQDDACWVLGKQ